MGLLGFREDLTVNRVVTTEAAANFFSLATGGYMKETRCKPLTLCHVQAWGLEMTTLPFHYCSGFDVAAWQNLVAMSRRHPTTS